MKKIIKRFLASILSMVTLYCLFAVGTGDFDFRSWPSEPRGLLVFTYVWGWVLYSMWEMVE